MKGWSTQLRLLCAVPSHVDNPQLFDALHDGDLGMGANMRALELLARGARFVAKFAAIFALLGALPHQLFVVGQFGGLSSRIGAHVGDIEDRFPSMERRVLGSRIAKPSGDESAFGPAVVDTSKVPFYLLGRRPAVKLVAHVN